MTDDAQRQDAEADGGDAAGGGPKSGATSGADSGAASRSAPAPDPQAVARARAAAGLTPQRVENESAGDDHGILETVQSLVVAFVIAMTFRAFVTEGFVIPTGSMAPTLLGKHVRFEPPESGTDFAAGVDQTATGERIQRASAPSLGPEAYGSAVSGRPDLSIRAGDRILVHKSLYPFKGPDRFDVVVFKNPTDPNGPAGNYIKRLVGLPNEAIWLVDGDVFAAPADGGEDGALDASDFRVARKPLHVQQAVWQEIQHVDHVPPGGGGATSIADFAWYGGDDWSFDEADRTWRTDGSDASALDWDPRLRPIDDWAPYNQLGNAGFMDTFATSDVRVAATITPAEDGGRMVMRIDALDHRFEWILEGRTATVRMVHMDWVDLGNAEELARRWDAAIREHGRDLLRADRPARVECWHADQALSLHVNGREVARLEYDWTPRTRLEHATNAPATSDALDDLGELALRRPARQPMLALRIGGAPARIDRLDVDRDIHYRTHAIVGQPSSGTLRPMTVSSAADDNPAWPGVDPVRPNDLARATHPASVQILGPDHFFMCGDNSGASSDSRMWGHPHPIVAANIDAAPFVVHRSLLLGKAWVVYFPSPLPITSDGRFRYVPDAGRMRFIR